ncbi:MAG: UbiA family prenyltransferase [Candidatus Bathyarchaeota archaeon]|nr:UbiA family prenyltransferase [Candidatus Bathyarchaeota archaeon]
MWSWCVLIACMVATGGSPPLQVTVLTLASILLVGTSTYIYNDLIDSDMDSISEVHKNRPIASSRVRKSDAWPTIIISGAVGLGLSYLVSLPVFLLCLGWLILFTVYSHPRIRLKKMFLIKELVVSSGWPIISIIGSYAVLGSLSLPALFSGLLFGAFTFLGLPALSDSFDAFEDGVYGVKSLGRVLSWRRKVQMLGLAALLMMTVTPLTYSQLGFSVILPIVAVTLSLVMLRWAVLPITNGFEVHVAQFSRKIIYIYFLIIQVVLVVSSMSVIKALI